MSEIPNFLKSFLLILLKCQTIMTDYVCCHTHTTACQHCYSLLVWFIGFLSESEIRVCEGDPLMMESMHYVATTIKGWLRDSLRNFSFSAPLQSLS